MKTKNILIAVAIVVAVVVVSYTLLHLIKRRRNRFRDMFYIKPGMIMLDAAASPLPFDHLFDILRSYSCYYSNIHRGSGISSLLSTHCYERSKEVVKDFVNAKNGYFVAYGKNATEQLNLLVAIIAQLFTRGVRKRTAILLSSMEHHSNDLPWRYLTRIGMRVDYINLSSNSWEGIDYSDLEQKVNKYGQDLNIISVTGISNVTGIRVDLARVSKLAKSVGAYICVDGAQLVPHTKTDMTALGIDFFAFSAHKIYCPFGLGVLIGREDVLNSLVESPLIKGGGEIVFVCKPSSSDFGVVWKKDVDLLEGGTSPILGAVALSNALKTIMNIGFDEIEKHEARLYSEAYYLFSSLNITVVSPDPKFGTSSSILSFHTPSYDSGLIGSILCYEYGICCRAGCMCAIILVSHLVGKTDDDLASMKKAIENGQSQPQPGIVRISLAMYNTLDEVHAVYNAVKNILDGKIMYTYKKVGDSYVPDIDEKLKCECIYDKILKPMVEP